MTIKISKTSPLFRYKLFIDSVVESKCGAQQFFAVKLSGGFVSKQLPFLTFIMYEYLLDRFTDLKTRSPTSKKNWHETIFDHQTICILLPECQLDQLHRCFRLCLVRLWRQFFLGYLVYLRFCKIIMEWMKIRRMNQWWLTLEHKKKLTHRTFRPRFSDWPLNSWWSLSKFKCKLLLICQTKPVINF